MTTSSETSPAPSAPYGYALAQQIAEERGLLLEREEFFEQRTPTLRVGLNSAPPQVQEQGENNTVIVGSRTHAGKGLIILKGRDNLVVIGPYARMGGGKIEVIGDGTVFWFGAQGSCDSIIAMPRERQRIIIGDGCLFSARTLLETSDHHPIFDMGTGERVNGAGSIDIGNDVWIGRDVHVGKGAVIGSGSVVGSRSTVTGSKCAEEHNVYAGTPARKIREGVRWAHQKAETLDEYLTSDYEAQREAQRDWVRARTAAAVEES